MLPSTNVPAGVVPVPKDGAYERAHICWNPMSMKPYRSILCSYVSAVAEDERDSSKSLRNFSTSRRNCVNSLSLLAASVCAFELPVPLERESAADCVCPGETPVSVVKAAGAASFEVI